MHILSNSNRCACWLMPASMPSEIRITGIIIINLGLSAINLWSCFDRLFLFGFVLWRIALLCFASSFGSFLSLHAAVNFFDSFSRGMPYSSMLYAADLNSLASRREDISRKFFHNITQSTSCLHHLLPDPKLSSHNSRLRSYEKFPRLHTRTKRYRSFVQYALSHYQDRIYNS